jgi:hypothetical protein
MKDCLAHSELCVNFISVYPKYKERHNDTMIDRLKLEY